MRLIDADELLKKAEDIEMIDMWHMKYQAVVVYTNDIENAPTIEAEPVRHGKWIKNNNGTYSCSECHSWIPNEQHYYARYCLFCGAKMEE